MKLLLSFILIMSSFTVLADASDFVPSHEVCEKEGRRFRRIARRANVGVREARRICDRYYEALINANANGDLTTLDPGEEDDLEALLDSLGLRRNFYVQALRERFVLAMTPGVLEEEPSKQELLKAQDTWACLSHEPFERGNLSGSTETKVVGISFSGIGEYIRDNSGFEYAVINQEELISSDMEQDKVRAVRYEYYCERNGECNQENYDQRVLIVEETVRRQGLIGYIVDLIDGFGINQDEAVQTFLRANAVRALNRVTDNTCGWSSCELVTKYYECYEDRDAVIGLLGL